MNSITLKNRIVMGPMGNISDGGGIGRPSDQMIRYFAERARGGAGLITSGLIPISQRVDPTVTEPGDRTYFPRLDRSRTTSPAGATSPRACHAYGARFFVSSPPGWAGWVARKPLGEA